MTSTKTRHTVIPKPADVARGREKKVGSTTAPKSFTAFCPGKPEAQGGTVPLTRNGITRQVTRGSKGLSKWRKAMTAEFAAAASRIGITAPLDGALASELTFIIPRLSRHPKTKDGERWPITYRDADKLERAANDSLTKAGVIADDSRICVTRRVKRYAGLQETPGVIVRVWQLGGNDLEEADRACGPNASEKEEG